FRALLLLKLAPALVFPAPTHPPAIPALAVILQELVLYPSKPAAVLVPPIPLLQDPPIPPAPGLPTRPRPIPASATAVNA
ncbi:MAG: hypothetical protein NZL98_02730, partial [Anaerolineales bacterium]|nr:hypothetical protein [Anaerolineales bacterium]